MTKTSERIKKYLLFCITTRIIRAMHFKNVKSELFALIVNVILLIKLERSSVFHFLELIPEKRNAQHFRNTPSITL